jgi:hypothetical protein
MAPPDRSKDTVDESVHRSTLDTQRINRAIERVARGDDQFIANAVGLLDGLQFPAFKHKILDHVGKKTGDGEVIWLFESLNGYIAYKDAYHVQKAIEENGTKYKTKNQMSDETRQRPNFARPATAGVGIKGREVANTREERKDYPEIPPSTMSNFVCDMCGKPFQNQDDLVQHKRFEREPGYSRSSTESA